MTKHTTAPATASSASDAAVQARTGKTWAEWFVVLDAANAQKMSHKQIAILLNTRHNVPAWWSQMVTVEYERARGLRAMHEKTDGFSASISRTINAPMATLYALWHDPMRRAGWLGESNLEVSSATLNKSLRGRMGDTRVDVEFYTKGETKTQLSLQHSKLASAAQVKEMKAYWATALDNLKQAAQV